MCARVRVIYYYKLHYAGLKFQNLSIIDVWRKSVVKVNKTRLVFSYYFNTDLGRNTIMMSVIVVSRGSYNLYNMTDTLRRIVLTNYHEYTRPRLKRAQIAF